MMWGLALLGAAFLLTVVVVTTLMMWVSDAMRMERYDRSRIRPDR